MENQKLGHFALFRSVLTKDWARDYAKLALWVHLIGGATHKPRSVVFDGVKWDLARGQMVTKMSILCRKLLDPKGEEKTQKQLRGMLDFFVKEKMISYSGNRHGTLISILNYADYQADFEVTNKVTNEVTNKPSADLAYSSGQVTKLVTNQVEQNKNVFKQELKDTPKSPEGSLVEQEETKPKKQATSKFTFDRERFQDTWNCKAKKHGLPRITSISISTEKGIKRLYESHLLHCKQTKRSPADIDTFINGYIEFGYEPSPYAMGENPAGKKYGISTALTQRIIDQVISQEE